MEHSFNTDIAKIYGVTEAVFIHNLYFWIMKNECNNKHFYEGKFWTYNSLSAFEKLFPYLSRGQMRTVISNCVNKGAVLKGNFNKEENDKTCWFALTEKVNKIYASINTFFAKSDNQNAEKVSKNESFFGYAENSTGYAENSTRYAENSTGYAENSTGYAEISTGYAEISTALPDNKPYINTYKDKKDITPLPPKGGKEVLKDLLEKSVLSEPLKQKIDIWLAYKRFKYEPIGFKSLLTIAEKYEVEFGAVAVANVIDESMASNYKGITWDKLRSVTSGKSIFAGAAPLKKSMHDTLEEVFSDG